MSSRTLFPLVIPIEKRFGTCTWFVIPKKERTANSLRCKFQELAKKNPTGDQNCPPHVHSAKCIYQLIVKANDGSDGESGEDNVLPPNDDDDNNDSVGDDDEDDRGDAKDDEADDGGLVEPINL